MFSIFDDFDHIFRDFDKIFVSDRRNYLKKDGVEKHFHEGALHREDGPAVVYLDKSKQDEWWLEGEKVTEEKVKEYALQKEEKREHVVYLRGGKPYRVTGKQLKEIESLLGI